MCGRYSLVLTQKQIQAHFEQVEWSHQWTKCYNIAPTHQGLVITNKDPDQIQSFEFGLVSKFAHGKRFINARKESIDTKVSFKEAFRENRCLILADSYYEWKLYGKQKIPYRISYKNEALMVFAGVWNQYQRAGKIAYSFSIITAPAHQDVKHIHHRMPVLLDTKAKQREWIDDSVSILNLKAILKSNAPNQLLSYPVTAKLNRTDYNEPQAHKALPEMPDLFSGLS